MTERKWTPRPWRYFMGDICAQDDEVVICGMNKSCGARSSDYYTYTAKQPQAVANAHLIAAAPDLYEAAKAAECFCDNNGIINGVNVRAALAKARGEK